MTKTLKHYLEFTNNLFYIENPAFFLRELKITGEITAFPELSALVGIPQPMSHHPEGDVFEHTLLTIEKAYLLSANLNASESKKLLILSALLHDIGKPYSTRYNSSKSNISGGNHNLTGLKSAYTFLEKSGLLFHAEPVEFLIKMHSYPIKFHNNEEKSKDELELLKILALLRIADHSGRYKINNFIIPKDVIDFFEKTEIKMNFY